MTNQTSGHLVKAEIVNLETNTVVKCMFNPKEYTFSKSNSWSELPLKGENTPTLEFGGGEAATLSLELLFDTYEAHTTAGNQAGDDVRKYTKGLWDLMKISDQSKDPATGKGRPPLCKFQWGSLWSFEAVVTSISQRFTLFLSDGTPVRAILNVSFKQVKDEGQYPRQNPTSGGNPGNHLRTVYEGELLTGIAYEEYGDCAAWRHLAESNNIDDPRRLQPGQQLLITPLPPL